METSHGHRSEVRVSAGPCRGPAACLLQALGALSSHSFPSYCCAWPLLSLFRTLTGFIHPLDNAGLSHLEVLNFLSLAKTLFPNKFTLTVSIFLEATI